MIKEHKHNYQIVSKTTNKILGTFNFTTSQGKKSAHTKSLHRLKQIEYFKRQ